MALAASAMGPAFVGVQVPQEPSLNEQSVETGDSSKPFTDNTRFVRVHAYTTCRINFGSGGKRFVGGQTEYFGVTSGMKVSVEQSD